MPQVTVSESAAVPASPDVVYGILSDYETGHPAILPRRYFSNLRVLDPAPDGTSRIGFEMTLFGRTNHVTARIRPVEPGRILEEIDEERGAVTRFVIDATGDGSSRVEISTAWEAGGIQGLFERMLAPRLLRKMYRLELQNLAEYAAAQTSYAAQSSHAAPTEP